MFNKIMTTQAKARNLFKDLKGTNPEEMQAFATHSKI
jgi:hypothetical protein